jgi:hypothetical protein
VLVTLEERAVKVGLHVRLLVRAADASPVPALRDRLDAIFAHLVERESADRALLDSDMNATLVPGDAARADVRLTIEAADAGRAVDDGLALLRAAVRAAGCTAVEQSVDAKPRTRT